MRTNLTSTQCIGRMGCPAHSLCHGLEPFGYAAGMADRIEDEILASAQQLAAGPDDLATESFPLVERGV